MKITHPEMVATLVKPGEAILASITPKQCHELHMIIGISGEAGELLDALKKHIIYERDLDRENVIEELGDIEFYLEGLRQSLGITREKCLEANITKLSTRYESLKYSNQQAQERKDKHV